jgi:hypothetical protein
MRREVRPNPLLERLLDLREEPPQLSLSLSLSEEYSDNFEQTESDPEEEYITILSVGTVYRLERGHGFISLANTINAEYEARAEELNIGFVNLALNTGYQLPRLALALNASLVRDDDPVLASSSGLRQGRQTFLRSSVSPQMRYALSQLTSINLAYTNTLVTDADLALDTISHTVATGLDHRFSRVLTGRIGYDFTTTEDEDEAEADRQTHGASAGLDYLLDQITSLTLQASASATTQSGNEEDFSIYSIGIGGRRQLTSFLAIFVLVGPLVFLEEGKESRVFANLQLNLEGALLHSRRTTLTLTAGQDIVDTSTDVEDVGVVLRQSVGLTLNHIVSRRLQASLFVNFTRTEELVQFATVEAEGEEEEKETTYFWQAGARASYEVTRTLSLSVVYTHLQRNSNLPGEDYDENQVLVTLSSRFSLF